ncbi:protein shortage in chiasmata 1 ortholog isoform 2-T2 [Syngnathus typhle]
MFPCASFLALDYVFENRNSLTVMMDLLALPTPYISYKDDHYPHNGALVEDTYRKPWVKGKVISTFSPSTSVLDDLRETTQHINSTEKFHDPGSVKGKLEKVASCLADSAKLAHLCEDTFARLTTQLDFGTKDNDLLLPEDMVAANFLPSLKLLPTLKSKVSRLKTLLVADPLISMSGDSVIEETIFRHCVPYERSSDEAHLEDFITEVFTKESLTPNEPLLLPELLDNHMMTVNYPRSFSSVCHCLNVVAEEPEQLPDLEALFKDKSASVDICHFPSVESTGKEDWMKDTPPEWVTLPTEMELELEVTLTPPTADTSHCHPCLSSRDLQREELSPVGISSLVPAESQKQLRAVLWKAEKHPNYVLSLLFAEPEVEEAAVDFEPLNEALKSTSLESLAIEMEMGEFFGDMRESPERLTTDVPSREDFNNVLDCFQSISPEPEESKTALILVPNYTSSAEFAQKRLARDTNEVKSSSDHRSANKSCVQVSSVPPPSKLDANFRSQKTDKRGVVTAAGLHPVQHTDPVTAFMMLRSQQASTPTAAPEEEEERLSVVRLTPRQTRKADRKRPTNSLFAVVASGHATRGQMTAAAQDAPQSSVIQVQATGSQRQAYRELQSLAGPRLSSATELGLNLPTWRDFEGLASDQTRYVLKQRELATRRATPAARGDEEPLFHQVLVIHTLVRAKELLLKCHLSAAVDYLSKAEETCTDTGLIRLLRRLHIISHLGGRNHESDVKLLELQKLVAERLHDKILIIVSHNCDQRMSTIVQSLKQLTAVCTVHPDNDSRTLNGARVVKSVLGSRCVLVYEQHLGPDFPWDIFSLVVEYDSPGPSPWATVCKERRVKHLTFDTVLPSGDEQESEESFEDKVAYVLLVTESLLDRPLLPQMLKSTFNIKLLERSHCPSLQMLGGTNYYSIITVDESTAIVIQEQEELCEERACEAIVMRLTALSLQYNYCWIILHDPDSKGGGFSSEAFSNLVMIYSSVVLFGMKLEDLDVKVLIASEVAEVAGWVKQICFLSLMSSARNPVDYLERDWLAGTPSQEELILLHFPCINPLVAQLMLRRAPSLPWLLAASLTQLVEMLPEVPHKVLKLFSNITSLYEAQPARSGPIHSLPPTAQSLPPPPEMSIPAPELFPSTNPSFLLAPDDTENSLYSQGEPTFFTHDPKWPAGRPELSGLSGADLWKGKTSQKAVLTGSMGQSSVAGMMIERGSGEWSQQGPSFLDTTFSLLSPPSKGPLRRGGPTGTGSHTGGRSSVMYGSRCWMGQERKRNEDAADLPRIGEIWS